MTTRLEIPIDYAALTLVDVSDALARINATGCLDGDVTDPLPAGALSCGQIRHWLPMLMALLTDRFPQLLEPEGIDDALRNAVRDRRGVGLRDTLN